MLKKLLLAIGTLLATMGFAFAQVDVNKADQAALDGIKGIGPKTSKTILDERKKGGPFKDWADFENRVKGVGDKSADKLSEAGLTINGQPKPKTAAAKDAKKDERKDQAKTDSSKDAKATDAKEAKPAAKDAKAADAKESKKDTKEAKPDAKADAKK